jgi:hypothetical protein
MKNLICLATIATTFITFFAVKSVLAQGVFVEPFPSTGYSSTTIYVPSLAEAAGYINGTTTTTIVAPGSQSTYSNSNYLPGSNTFSGSNGYRNRRYPQPTVIFIQPTLYPQVIQSTCSTSVIGSPIPSPIALNQSGMPCR